MADYFWFCKTAHILSATILYGSGIAIAFICWFGYRSAMKSGELAALRAVLRLAVIADAWLTAPAVVFQRASGIVRMKSHDWSMASA
jgi:uncharacterized membrane protein